MHFDTVELYKKAINDGFEVACIEELKNKKHPGYNYNSFKIRYDF